MRTSLLALCIPLLALVLCAAPCFSATASAGWLDGGGGNSTSAIYVAEGSLGLIGGIAGSGAITNRGRPTCGSGNNYALLVFTPFGETCPPAGTNWYQEGRWVAASVANSPLINNATQHVCSGWAGEGSVGSGSGTNTSFTITSNSAITWLWFTNYWLDVQANGPGTVDVPAGWYSDGSVMVITATPLPGWTFLEWTGDITSTNNPLVTPFSQSINVIANFEPVPSPGTIILVR